MKLEIDTQLDSVEDIREAITILENAVKRKSGESLIENTEVETPIAQETTSESSSEDSFVPLFGFDQDTSKETSETSTPIEESQEEKVDEETLIEEETKTMSESQPIAPLEPYNISTSESNQKEREEDKQTSAEELVEESSMSTKKEKKDFYKEFDIKDDEDPKIEVY